MDETFFATLLIQFLIWSASVTNQRVTNKKLASIRMQYKYESSNLVVA